ncbi:hypothetical protein DAPPUDRAFT_116819 [Daphnia pulex]|uniref:Uncharacterized protein n=1 Tax=Daphnia pulex TaxID=6669 RepID=E9HQM1_DAPPU|nr:hypothetical protein DAPPUDRAFT_116819 [Daphnia pulex]|eukprot:EFX65952.1 hypothetical protein DAPPUDRAFT_116819 [Daphnia pulex]
MPRRRSNKRGLRGTRLNLGVFFNAVLRAIEEQGPQQPHHVEIQVNLNMPEEQEEAHEPQEQEEAPEPQEQEVDDEAADDEAAKPPDNSTKPIMWGAFVIATALR